MKQIFNTRKSRYSQFLAITKLLFAVFIPVFLIFSFTVGSFYTLKLLLIFILVLVYLFILSSAGRLELDNGVLSRKNFIKYWSIDVSSITDIIQGCSYSFFVNNWLRDYSSGLSFKTREEKFYEFPSDVQYGLVQDGSDPISILRKANPSIQFHFDAKSFRGRFGWIGDRRLGRRRMLFIFFILLLLVIAAIMHNIFNLF